jgi:hypothetical protein
MTGENKVSESLKKLQGYIERERFSGYDPYDGLNSELLRVFSLKSRVLRMALIQGMKRSPLNMRSLLGVRKGYNPKGLGLFLWGYSRLWHRDGSPLYRERITFFLELLEKYRSKNCPGNGWGYNFDWQSSAFFLPAYTPTVVNTGFIGHALIDCFRFTGEKKALELLLPTADFILKGLNRLEEKERLCFSYTPIDRYFVHNANLLGASLLIRLYKYRPESVIRDTALKALRYTMECQRADGSWFYSEKPGAHRIDSFHTGFNLQCLDWFLKEGYGQEYMGAFKKGCSFYAENFFLDDGTPKYYHNRIYPVDIHSPAQAAVFFSQTGLYPKLNNRIVNWMIDNMQGKNGAFYFQKTPLYTNSIPYMRWNQAWAFHALTSCLLRINREI